MPWRPSLVTVPIKHPPVTDATAKELYANAVVCAAPGCGKPLYRTPLTGTGRVLDSNIAHICGQAELGPRWEPAMSGEENRSAANLVVLCLGHAYEIDQKQFVDQFPVPLLKQWKQSQLAAYEAAVAAAAGQAVGYQLTDDEANEVINKSEGNTATITITAETVNLGGGGGQAPQSAGGGGAALGSGVVTAGDGGDVRIDLDGQSGQLFGGGGGGGGVVLPGAVQNPAHLAGLEGIGYIAGFDGDGGGEATFSSGDLIIRASGVEGGGLCVPGPRSTSDELTVSALMSVNYAQIFDGMASIVGGAWRYIPVLNLPCTEMFNLFTVIEAGDVPAGVYSLRVEVRNPSGELRARARSALVIETAAKQVRVPAAFGLAADIDEYGLWRISVASELVELSAITVMVKRVQVLVRNVGVELP